MRNIGLSIAAAALAVGMTAAVPQSADAASAAHPPQRDFSFIGFFGSFDRAELQRGLQVYTEVCASCHGLDLIRYRELEDIGYTLEQVKAFAAGFELTDGPDEDGEMFDRPALPSDAFVNPYANENEAAASNGGKAPPDLSLIVKSRAHGQGSIALNFLDMLRGGEFASGADYVTALMADGYSDDPTLEDKMHCMPQDPGESHADWEARLNEWEIPEGGYFNKWFPGCAIGMPSPLYENAVEYADGTPANMEQMAHDVATFLTWAAEPTLEVRKEMGIKVLLFLAIFTGVLVAVKRETWKSVRKH